MYDITNKWSFDGIDRWLKEVEEVSDNIYNFPIALLLYSEMFDKNVLIDIKFYSTRPVYQKYWLAIVCTWLSKDKWGNEMQRLMQLRIEWRFSKSRLSATSIFARASQNSLAWRCIETAWKDCGDPIKVSYI